MTAPPRIGGKSEPSQSRLVLGGAFLESPMPDIQIIITDVRAPCNTGPYFAGVPAVPCAVARVVAAGELKIP
jgi:hypothetical protein